MKMVVIQLSDEQVAAISNRAKAPDRPVRTRGVPKPAKAGGRDCDRCIERVDNLVQTVLADLRALQVAVRVASRREIESRVVAIIDGIENTIAED